MNPTDIFHYYSREDVQNALLGMSRNREVAGVYRSGNFGARPNTLVYPQDITAMARAGVVEFHCSLERWSQPMGLKYENYEGLRTGWDIILDLDCNLTEHGKIAAEVFIWALKKHGIKNFSLKYTGGTGFHIGIPWESVPKKIDYKESIGLFPDLPRQIGLYLKDFARERLEAALLKRYRVEELAKQVEKPLGKLSPENVALDPFQIVEVDPVLISPRHLLRMPYSIHRKTFLVSLPLRSFELESFQRKDARPGAVSPKLGFLDFDPRDVENEAESLVAEAVDWGTRRQVEERKRFERKFSIKKPVPLNLAPPCVQNILKGLQDGRKRSIFILINYLSTLKWGWQDIEKSLTEWNRKNKPPLRDNYIRTSFRWHERRGKAILPPNCAHEGWYGSFGVCQPDRFCGGQAKTVKNPVSYPFRRMKK